MLCGLISWALSFGAWRPSGSVRISPFPELLVPAYLILFWSFSAAFLIMAPLSYLSCKERAVASLKDMPGVWCAYTTIQALLTSSATGIAAASSRDEILPLMFEMLKLVLDLMLTQFLVLHRYGAEGRRQPRHLSSLKLQRMSRANGDGLFLHHHNCFRLPFDRLPFLKVFLPR